LISFVTPASKERLQNRLYRRRRNPIVVDRRGTRDIVTSYAGIVPFCDDDYGRIFETAGALASMPDWKMIPDGLSDAKVFAEFGIPSVNLSRLSTRTY
jgi:hypothetical protein